MRARTIILVLEKWPGGNQLFSQSHSQGWVWSWPPYLLLFSRPVIMSHSSEIPCLGGLSRHALLWVKGSSLAMCFIPSMPGRRQMWRGFKVAWQPVMGPTHYTAFDFCTHVGEDLRLASGSKSMHLLKDLFPVIDNWGESYQPCVAVVRTK